MPDILLQCGCIPADKSSAGEGNGSTKSIGSPNLCIFPIQDDPSRKRNVAASRSIVEFAFEYEHLASDNDSTEIRNVKRHPLFMDSLCSCYANTKTRSGCGIVLVAFEKESADITGHLSLENNHS